MKHVIDHLDGCTMRSISFVHGVLTTSPRWTVRIGGSGTARGLGHIHHWKNKWRSIRGGIDL